MQGPIANQLKDAMEKRVSNWQHKPGMAVEFSSLVTRLSLLVKPSGPGLKQWKIVSGGARSHTITPKKKSRLFIHGGIGGYKSKTAPGNVYGRSSSYSGNSFWASSVQHPGVQPRKFEENVVNDEKAKIEASLQRIVDGAIK